MASGSDPCMDLSEKVQVTSHLASEAVTHTCQISACCRSCGSTVGFQWQESLSSQWSLRLDPSQRMMGCCCHWRRDEEGWQSHRHYWWLRRSLGSHRRGGGEEIQAGGEWRVKMIGQERKEELWSGRGRGRLEGESRYKDLLIQVVHNGKKISEGRCHPNQYESMSSDQSRTNKFLWSFLHWYSGNWNELRVNCNTL